MPPLMVYSVVYISVSGQEVREKRPRFCCAAARVSPLCLCDLRLVIQNNDSEIYTTAYFNMEMTDRFHFSETDSPFGLQQF